jgi:hypothetical protein
MKTGRSLMELAQELERQRETKRDYVVDTARGIEMHEDFDDGNKIKLAIKGNGSVGLNELAHEQLAGSLEIPRAYYRRMLDEDPTLLVKNVNTWLVKNPETRMLRTLDGKARAWLSSKYRALDYFDFAEAVLPVLADLNLEVISSEVTERRLYFKAVSMDIQKDIPTGRMGDGSHTIFDTVSPAIVLRNSEVGCGALAVETAVWTRACTNLAVFSERSMRKYHVGGRFDMGEDVAALLTDETRRADDRAVWLKVRDVVKGAFDRARFDALTEKIGKTAAEPIDGDPVVVVEAAGRVLGLNEGERGGVLRHLIRGGDLTRYGLFNAVTRTAEDAPDYDRAYELETAGAALIDLPATAWRSLGSAAAAA